MADRVLLLGSTGFVGRAVGSAILDSGHQLRLLVRDQGRLPPLGMRRVEVRVGDALSLDDLRSACREVDHMVSLVAVRRDQPQSLIEVNADGPRLLALAAREAGLRSIVFISAVGAGAGPRPRYRYLTSRWMGEEELRRSGVPTAILRFSLILGENGGVVEDFDRAASLGPVMVIPGGGTTRFQPIVRDDVARCIALAIGRQDLLGQALDLGGPEVLTYENLFEIFARARGLRKPRVKLPLGLLMPGAAAMELLWSRPPVVPDELRTLELDNLAGGLDSVVTHFGFSPLSPSHWAAEHWGRPIPQNL